MKIGMLWFDDDPKRDLATKIQQASDYYRGKYGHKPTTCHLNALVGRTPDQIGGLSIILSPLVLPDHLWIGRDDT
jgi:hypothetical protein